MWKIQPYGDDSDEIRESGVKAENINHFGAITSLNSLHENLRKNGIIHVNLMDFMKMGKQF